MSLDSLWLCPTLARNSWTEIVLGLDDTASRHAAFVKAQAYGLDENLEGGRFIVRVSAGKNLIFDEEYFFLTRDDADKFYEDDVIKRQFVDEDGSGYGFQEVSLYVDGVLSKTRSHPPEP